jgi:hypothetical protein
VSHLAIKSRENIVNTALKNAATYIVAVVLFFVSNTSYAQDSTRQTATPTPATSPGASVNNPNLTVPPIILPEQPRRPRKRRLTAADSARLAAQRDSIALAAQIAAAGNSTFNIGTPQQNIITSPTPAVDSTALKQNATVPDVPILSESDNPFDILRGANPAAETATSRNTNPITDLSNVAVPSLLSKQTYSKNFLFWIFLITLIMMALVVANARAAVQNAYQGLLSNNALRQTYREQSGWGTVHQLALYILFWVNGGIFAFLMLYHFNISLPYGQFLTFLACVLGVSLVFIVKHAILYIIASVFPIEKEIKLYNFIIMTAGILLGLTLLPFNIFIAYAPASLAEILTYGAFVLIGLVYLVRSLRSLSVASPFLATDQFHFFLYLCAVEIAPLMVLIKLMTFNITNL